MALLDYDQVEECFLDSYLTILVGWKKAYDDWTFKATTSKPKAFSEGWLPENECHQRGELDFSLSTFFRSIQLCTTPSRLVVKAGNSIA